MKKTLAMLLSLALCVGLFAGCSSSGSEESAAPSGSPSTETSAEPAGNEETSTLSGTVNLNGSTSVENVILTLGEAFMEANPDVTVNYDPTGSGTGINAALEGTCDLGLASRDLDEEETAQGLTSTVFALDGIAIIVNSENPVSDLTIEQIAGLATGEITNWREVGGEDQSIRPFQRAEDSGSQSALERLMDGLPLVEPELEDRVGTMGGIIQEVASYRNYRNAIGFSFRFYATEMVESGDIRLLALDGVEPTRETIRDESYPITETFYAVTAAPVGEPPLQERDPTAAAFLDWILSDQGQQLIEQTGYVALK